MSVQLKTGKTPSVLTIHSELIIDIEVASGTNNFQHVIVWLLNSRFRAVCSIV